MKAFINFCFSCALLLVPSLMASAQTTTPTTTASSSDKALAIAGSKDERYRIGFQDRLEIQVFRHPDLTQRVDVNQNGTINLLR